jgi:hypothetical protein
MISAKAKRGAQVPARRIYEQLPWTVSTLKPVEQGIRCPRARALKQRPDIGAAVTADLASKFWLQIGRANVISQRPASITTVVATTDDEPSRGAGRAHFCWRFTGVS